MQKIMKIEDLKTKEVRFMAGIGLGAVGTLLVVYLMPGAVSAYHWSILLLALMASIGFAYFLFYSDYDDPEPVRLRLFLRLYFFALVTIFVAPGFFLNDMVQGISSAVPAIARLLPVIPLVAVFVAIIVSFSVGSNISTVFLRHK